MTASDAGGSHERHHHPIRRRRGRGLGVVRHRRKGAAVTLSDIEQVATFLCLDAKEIAATITAATPPDAAMRSIIEAEQSLTAALAAIRSIRRQPR